MATRENSVTPNSVPSRSGSKLQVDFSPMDVLNNLMRLHNRLHVPFNEHVERRFKIGMNEWIFLTQIGRLGTTASHELVDITGFRPMAVSRAIAALRAHGRVEQWVDPENRRRKMLRLTPKGQELYALMQSSGDRVAEFLFESLRTDEVVAFNHFIEVMSKRLEETDEHGNSLFLERTKIIDDKD